MTGHGGRVQVRGLPVGDHALLLEVDTDEAALALHAELLRRAEARTLPAVREIVPAARTVLLDGVADPRRLAAEVARWDIPPPADGRGATVEIPVRYDGPDLADVAELWGGSPRRRSRASTRAPRSGSPSAASPLASAI